MRRLVASLALVVFVAVPVLQWQCEVSCAADVSSEAPGGCHHDESGAVIAMASDHDCGEHAPPAVLRTEISTTDSALAVVLAIVNPVAPIVRPFEEPSHVAFGSLSPPLANFATPLRL